MKPILSVLLIFFLSACSLSALPAKTPTPTAPAQSLLPIPSSATPTLPFTATETKSGPIIITQIVDVQTSVVPPSSQTSTQEPSATPPPTAASCAFVEGRLALEELSGQFLDQLKSAGLPVEKARAEAYGENCVAADGSQVRFAAKETDFYLTLNVTDLLDEAALGALLERALAIVELFPVGQTPGPNPGYVGVAFTAGADIQNLWFTRSQANDLRIQGLKGAELYRALKGTP